MIEGMLQGCLRCPGSRAFPGMILWLRYLYWAACNSKKSRSLVAGQAKLHCDMASVRWTCDRLIPGVEARLAKTIPAMMAKL